MLYARLAHIPLRECVNEKLRARMRPIIHLEQPRRIDAGIDLRCGKAGMAEQFLNGAQIAAAGKQVGGKGMAQCMRCRRLRQAEGAVGV